MKSLLLVSALLSVTASAFADHTKFVPAATVVAPTLAAPTRAANTSAPYSRSVPRNSNSVVTAPRHEPARDAANRPVPYSRSQSRFVRTNA